MHETSLPQ